MRTSSCVLAFTTLVACAGDPEESKGPLSATETDPIVANYAALVIAGYDDSLSTAEALRTALADFTASPSATTQQAAKDAWLAARTPYGQTEAFRFYNGPIDNEATGPEGQINAWPMDEAYVDYVVDMPDTGIINDPSVTISKEMLASLNEAGGEANIATGYHAIEFLLWGQDLSADGPGARSFEDFVDGGPRANPDRRRQYLDVVSELLVDDLRSVREAWTPIADDIPGFGEPAEAIQKMMRGIGALSGGELSEERMNVAYDTKLQEDEHSCFSDNTHNDILHNFLGIKNVWFGDYGSVNGPGIDELVRARDPELADRVEEQLEHTEADIRAIPAPFDTAIQGDDAAPGRVAVADAVNHLRELADLLVEAAGTMDITLNTALE